MSEASVLDARDDMLELAERYEQVASLDLASLSDWARSAFGSRVPPGAQAILDADEVARTLALADQAVFHWCMVLLDAEQIDDVPDLTPARARMCAQHTDWFLHHEGDRFALDFVDDLSEVLRQLGHLAARGTRLVRTGHRCLDPVCHGHLVSPLGSDQGDRHDDALHCDRCGKPVPYSVWSGWPRARIRFITVEHAARLASTSTGVIRNRASVLKWRRVGTGHDVRYAVDDVRRWIDGDAPEDKSA